MMFLSLFRVSQDTTYLAVIQINNPLVVSKAVRYIRSN
jgi:hypothetical protein